MTNEENKNSLGEEEFKTLMVPELNTSRLAFLGLLAFVFSSLEPFVLFASIPFSISFLLYGKLKTFAMGVLGTGIAFGLTQIQLNHGSALGTFPAALIYGYLIARTVWNKTHPYRGILLNGTLVYLVLAGLLFAVNSREEGGIRGLMSVQIQQFASQSYEQVVNSVGAQGEQIRYFKDLMEKPEIWVDPFLNYGAGIIFVFVMLCFWVGTFVVLRMAPIWKPFHDYDYDVKTLTGLKLPFALVWPLMGFLALSLSHAYEFAGEWAEIVGINALTILGVFYFFQGFGIFSELLTFWNFFGFLRMMAIFFAVVMAHKILALVGVLDTWVDFRRFFIKENDEQNF